MLENIRIVEQNRTARRDKAVFLGVDQRFHAYALFIADQIANKLPERDFDICIVSPESLPPHPLWDQHGLRICRLETSGLGERVRTTQHLSFASYLCVLAPLVFTQDYHRLLYMDADMFYRRGALSRLLDLDIAPHPLGAVRDMSQLRKPNRRHRDFRTMKLPYAKYFNTGFLLIDTEQYRKDNIAHRAIELALRYAQRLNTNDQSVCNAAAIDNWAELPPVWNFQYSYQTMYFSGMFDICCYHFIGRKKPFHRGGAIFPRHITEEYRRFFATHWPELESQVPDGLQVNPNRWPHLCALLFHLANYRSSLRNEGHWRSDWDVKRSRSNLDRPLDRPSRLSMVAQ